jgi:hypothetical protein
VAPGVEQEEVEVLAWFLMQAVVRSRHTLVFGLVSFCSSMGLARPELEDKPYKLHSAMPAYWRFLRLDSKPERRFDVKLFRAEVIEPNQDVFSAVAGRSLGDSSLKAMIRALAPKSEQMRRVEAEFPDRLARAWQRFAEHAPDLKPSATVFLLPAPRFALGGSVRPLGERDAVVFGTEEIALTLESTTGFEVLVHHEMTHLYHIQVNPEMRQMTAEVYMPPYALNKAKLYQVVWLEGLAVYWSKVLNPRAPDKEVLVSGNLAERVVAGWPRIASDLRQQLDSSRKEDIDAYMFGGNTHGRFPHRTGYYVGMLIAERLAKRYSFAQLCRLSGPRLRSEVEEALRDLEKSPLRRQ